MKLHTKNAVFALKLIGFFVLFSEFIRCQIDIIKCDQTTILTIYASCLTNKPINNGRYIIDDVDSNCFYHRLSNNIIVVWVSLLKSLKFILKNSSKINSNISDAMEFVSTCLQINDPYFKYQWYLMNVGQTNGPLYEDINVVPVWVQGVTGKGVVVSVIDDGVDHRNPDLNPNYEESANFEYSLLNNEDIVNNKTKENDYHGTRCAGEIAAKANNSFCGVGVAFNAKIGGIQMLSMSTNDSTEALYLSYNRNYIDIYCNSWGPDDDGKTFGGPGPLALDALKRSATYGRQGKGNIFVWATGNGGLLHDDCNCDGYVNSIYTIAIGSISDYGLSVYYTESCAATLAVTYNGGSHRKRGENFVITTENEAKCTTHFSGTSSAAPISCGIFSLVLEVNNNLTWRDMQHLIVHSSDLTSPLDPDWVKNGANHYVNHKFGFGKLNAHSLVSLGKIWKNVQPQMMEVSKPILNGSFTTKDVYNVTYFLDLTNLTKLEHVVVKTTFYSHFRGFISIDLVSPMGTLSHLLSKRKYDKKEGGVKDWEFMTIRNWDEHPRGLWTITFKCYDRTLTSNSTSRKIANYKTDIEDLEQYAGKENLQIVNKTLNNQISNVLKIRKIYPMKSSEKSKNSRRKFSIIPSPIISQSSSRLKNYLKVSQVQMIFYGT